LLADLFGVATTLPWLAVLVRRLHDAGLSGRWLWIALTGVGVIVLLVFAALSPAPRAARYGPSPDSPAEVLRSPAAYPALGVVDSGWRAGLLRVLVWTGLGLSFVSSYLATQGLSLISDGWADLVFVGSAVLVVVALVLHRGVPLTPRLTRRPRWSLAQ